jgi:hypothetical protein
MHTTTYPTSGGDDPAPASDPACLVPSAHFASVADSFITASVATRRTTSNISKIVSSASLKLTTFAVVPSPLSFLVLELERIPGNPSPLYYYLLSTLLRISCHLIHRVYIHFMSTSISILSPVASSAYTSPSHCVPIHLHAILRVPPRLLPCHIFACEIRPPVCFLLCIDM